MKNVIYIPLLLFFNSNCVQILGLEDKKNPLPFIAEDGGDEEIIEEDRLSEDFHDFEIEVEKLASCGNLIVEYPEECDDGKNGNQDDGCKDDCTFTCHNDNECNDGHNCTLDFCNLLSHTCDFHLLPEETVCRPSSGICDIEEYCDGINPDCPDNVFKQSNEICRYSRGVCWDVEEYCTGESSDCPPDDENGPIYGISAISAGDSHTCAFTTTGGVKCWGDNEHGQLGDGTTTNKTTPVNVTGLSSGVIAISAGGHHTCALLNTGEVKCWGYNEHGQLGDGTNTEQPLPVYVCN